MKLKCKICGADKAKYGRYADLCGQCYQNQYNDQRRAKGLFSHQREWQLKQVAMGLCMICRQPRNRYKSHCDACAERIREQNRGRQKGRHYSKTYAEGRKRHEHKQSS